MEEVDGMIMAMEEVDGMIIAVEEEVDGMMEDGIKVMDLSMLEDGMITAMEETEIGAAEAGAMLEVLQVKALEMTIGMTGALRMDGGIGKGRLEDGKEQLEGGNPLKRLRLSTKSCKWTTKNLCRLCSPWMW